MKKNKLIKISKLIEEKKIDKAQLELSKLGSEFYKNHEYRYKMYKTGSGREKKLKEIWENK